MLERLKRAFAGVVPSPAAESAVPDAPSPAPAASSSPAPGGTPADAREIMVIDVRSEREFETVAIAQALNVPLPQLEHRIRELVSDPATPLVLYCASGARSGLARRVLERLGYRQVTDAGGLFAAAARLQRDLRH